MRPSAAVPTAGSTAVAAQTAYDDDDDGFAVPWIAVGVVAVAIGVMLWIAVDDDSEGEGSLSQG